MPSFFKFLFLSLSLFASPFVAAGTTGLSGCDSMKNNSISLPHYNRRLLQGGAYDPCACPCTCKDPPPTQKPSPTPSPTPKPTQPATPTPTPTPVVTPTPDPIDDSTDPPIDDPIDEPPPDDSSPPPEDPPGDTSDYDKWVQSQLRMTSYFPLGSCKMSGKPSLPYVLSVAEDKIGKFCLLISFSPNMVDDCAKYQLSGPCQAMVTKLRKIVFWYRHATYCGYDLTTSRRSGTVFPWRIRSGRTVQNVGKYQMIAKNATVPHAVGDLILYKWSYQGKSSVQVDVGRSIPFKRGVDSDLDGYKLCFIFKNGFDFPGCIAGSGFIKYSFYDPYKSICTVGQVDVHSLGYA
jgi:hypothetical protein